MGWLTFFLYELFAVGAFGMAWAATGAVLASLRARAIYDHPNERSSHDTPTPRGAGLAVVGGDLWSIESEWELTELEKRIIAFTRREV